MRAFGMIFAAALLAATSAQAASQEFAHSAKEMYDVMLSSLPDAGFTIKTRSEVQGSLVVVNPEGKDVAIEFTPGNIRKSTVTADTDKATFDKMIKAARSWLSEDATDDAGERGNQAIRDYQGG